MSETSATDGLFLRATLLVAALTLLGMTGFQCYVLVQTRQNLQTTRANQERPLKEGAALRQRIEGIAGRVAQLADEGNPNAKMIVENFRRQGIELHTPQSAGTNSPPAEKVPTDKAPADTKH